jgi:predicted permease
MTATLIHLARTLRRSPASAGAAILTLSLTLGAAATILAIVDTVLLTPPPFVNPDALVTLGETPVAEPAAQPRAVRFATFDAWRERAGSLAAIEAMDGTNLTLTGLGPAERISATDVTAGFLPLLGVAPVRGRAFTEDDLGQPVAMITTVFWRNKLGATPDVVGQSLVLGGRPHTIIGVLPEDFFFALNPSDVWRPLPVPRARASAGGYLVRPVARLADGVSPSNLAGALDDISRKAAVPAYALATPLSAAITGDASRAIAILAGAAAVALLIAFANLAGLLIVRSLDRRRELAVRSALGAGRGEIARQLLLESAGLVAFGIAGGILLAAWWTPPLAALALEQFGALARSEVTINWKVFAALSAVAMSSALICGLIPAASAARLSLVEVLRRGSTAPPRELAWRRVLVTGEVALAFVLLLCMTVLGRSLLAVLAVNPGFQATGVLTMSVSLPSAAYPDDARVAGFYRSLERSLQERIGEDAVSVVDELPLTGDRGRALVRPGATAAGHEAVVRSAGPGYFDVMRIPVVTGRTFEQRDDAAAPLRVVVSRSLSERLFGGEPALGRQISVAGRNQPAEIIGIVGDVPHRSLDAALIPTIYLSAWQAPSPSSQVVVRSIHPDAEVLGIVRSEVARLDRNLPVYRMQRLSDILAASPGVPVRRVLTAAFTAFALLALVLGAIGLFGVAAHDVARRRSELALRMAVGADPMRILRATLGQGVRMIAVGLAAGALLSFWAVRGIDALRLADASIDAISVALPALVLLTAGLAAVLPAARRAARMDPLIALRSE